MKNLNALDWVAIILVVVGGLNWGLYAFGYNLVDMLFGSIPVLAQIVYILVALSAIYLIVVASRLAKKI